MDGSSPSPAAPSPLSPPESPELPPMEDGDVAAVEAALGYCFSDKLLVAEALTHGSYYLPDRPGPNYDRLEFMGDALLSQMVAREMFVTYPHLQPGQLTNLRAANVDRENLGRVAVVHGLHRFIRHKIPGLQSQIEDFMNAIDQYPIHSNGLITAPKVLGDIVESLIGACYVDSSFSQDAAQKGFRNLFKSLITPETLGRHPVTELLEFCQKYHKGLLILKDDWDKNLTVEVSVDGELVGSATYGQKKEIAQNRAAKLALENLKRTLGNPDLEDIGVARCDLH